MGFLKPYFDQEYVISKIGISYNSQLLGWICILFLFERERDGPAARGPSNSLWSEEFHRNSVWRLCMQHRWCPSASVTSDTLWPHQIDPSIFTLSCALLIQPCLQPSWPKIFAHICICYLYFLNIIFSFRFTVCNLQLAFFSSLLFLTQGVAVCCFS